MHNNADNHHSDERNTIRFHLPATVDNFHLAALLNPQLENQQCRVCLDVSRVSRLGMVEFRVLTSFARDFKSRGGFLSLENASDTLTALIREFGFIDLLADRGQKSSG